MTDSKVPTCLDTDLNNLILSGSEDGVIRLWDTRGTTKSAQRFLSSTYKGHSGWITQVRFNPRVDNVFVSTSIDGTVRLWDIRNDEAPLANLKHKMYKSENGQINVNDLKMFSTDWNGSSQILSGGSDSHVSVHTM